MFDLEDGFIIESCEVQWLIWIHLIVTILFVILLFCGLSIFASDASNNPTCNSASTSSSSQSRGRNVLFNSASSSHSTKVEGNISILREIEASTGKDIVGGESLETEQSSAKDLALSRLFGHADHPCNYLRLAQQAILKCLGLGYSYENSRQSKHGKED